MPLWRPILRQRCPARGQPFPDHDVWRALPATDCIAGPGRSCATTAGNRHATRNPRTKPPPPPRTVTGQSSTAHQAATCKHHSSHKLRQADGQEKPVDNPPPSGVFGQELLRGGHDLKLEFGSPGVDYHAQRVCDLVCAPCSRVVKSAAASSRTRHQRDTVPCSNEILRVQRAGIAPPVTPATQPQVL